MEPTCNDTSPASASNTYRILHTPEIDTTHIGFVAGVYHHLGDHLKVGLGYNFGRFSDDVADLTHDDRGIFLNVTGKF